MWRVFLLGVLLLPGACARTPGPGSPVPLDAGRELARPDSSAESGPDRGRPDLALPKLSCAAPKVAGTGFKPGALAELALSADGLRLFATCATGTCSASRPATDQPFEAWAGTTKLPGSDPAFFFHRGVEHLVIARSPDVGKPRRLELCSWPGLACAVLPIADAHGEVAYDLDGPSVAVIGERLLLAHNIGVGGETTADIFLAEPIDAADLGNGFQTSAVVAINQPSWKEDDPALSPDGLLLVFGAEGSAGHHDLWISQRPTLADPFAAPEILLELSTSAEDKHACFGPIRISSGKPRYELFFESTRSGQTQIYRSECTR